ncbi:hypothetical protein HYH02_010308 [Chlamydomonas schloesseri]|uniref:Uncharacterized protein n=1 Tax=Chlamydomonas schloesseri TaxID=2026947 RepID=A0A835TMH3_9CHLO|nr:hypothetical protein HYH02_010308 [Chlamydomonas schloesseri]|eukprot:KAG2440420.1 hypothetical protein HYH02_010308 [Chlamydomonas schloesseri]
MQAPWVGQTQTLYWATGHATQQLQDHPSFQLQRDWAAYWATGHATQQLQDHPSFQQHRDWAAYWATGHATQQLQDHPSFKAHLGMTEHCSNGGATASRNRATVQNPAAGAKVLERLLRDWVTLPGRPALRHFSKEQAARVQQAFDEWSKLEGGRLASSHPWCTEVAKLAGITQYQLQDWRRHNKC